MFARGASSSLGAKCVRPGCGKPTWNGKAGEYCTRECRDAGNPGGARPSTTFRRTPPPQDPQPEVAKRPGQPGATPPDAKQPAKKHHASDLGAQVDQLQLPEALARIARLEDLAKQQQKDLAGLQEVKQELASMRDMKQELSALRDMRHVVRDTAEQLSAFQRSVQEQQESNARELGQLRDLQRASTERADCAQRQLEALEERVRGLERTREEAPQQGQPDRAEMATLRETVRSMLAGQQEELERLGTKVKQMQSNGDMAEQLERLERSLREQRLASEREFAKLREAQLSVADNGGGRSTDVAAALQEMSGILERSSKKQFVELEERLEKLGEGVAAVPEISARLHALQAVVEEERQCRSREVCSLRNRLEDMSAAKAHQSA